MFAARIENVSSASFQDTPQAESLHQPRYSPCLVPPGIAGKRIERTVIQRYRHAFVAQLCQDYQSIFQPKLAQPVRVVPQQHAAFLPARPIPDTTRSTPTIQYTGMKTVVFFDIDGTLLRSGGAGKLAMLTAVQEAFGVSRAPVDVPFSGRTDRAIMRDLLHAHQVPFTEENFHRLVQAYLRLLPDCLHQMSGRVLPGVVELLDALQSLSHVAVGLLTGNLRRGAEAKLGYFSLFERFAFGGFGDHHEERNAVACEAIVAAQQHLNGLCSPERVWVIGDTPLDIQCARFIGARVLAVATGTHSLEELQACRPDLALPDLSHYQVLLECLH